MSINCDKDQISFNFSGPNDSEGSIYHKSNYESRISKKSDDLFENMTTPSCIEDLTEEQEKRLDRYVDDNGCSYAEAFIILYGSEDKIDLSGDINADLVTESPSSGLTEDWSKLKDSLSYFEKAEKYNGYIKQRERQGAQDSEVDRIEKKRCAIRQMGVDKFNQAFGTDELIKAGFEKDNILFERQKALDEFLDKYVGPGKDKQRRKFGRNIVKYCDSIK